MDRETLYGFEVRKVDRRRNPDRKTHDIQQLWQRSHEILNLSLLGYKGSEISGMLNICPETVSNTLNSTLGLEAMADNREARDDEFDKLQRDVIELTKKSLKIYNEILVKEDESMKLKKDTADTIVLELSGLRAPTRIDSRSIHTTATLEEIESFKKRGREAAKANGNLVVVENEGSR